MKCPETHYVRIEQLSSDVQHCLADLFNCTQYVSWGISALFLYFPTLCRTCSRITLQPSLLLSVYPFSNYPTEISYFTSFSYFYCCVLTSLSFILSFPSFLFLLLLHLTACLPHPSYHLTLPCIFILPSSILYLLFLFSCVSHFSEDGNAQ